MFFFFYFVPDSHKVILKSSKTEQDQIGPGMARVCFNLRELHILPLPFAGTARGDWAAAMSKISAAALLQLADQFDRTKKWPGKRFGESQVIGIFMYFYGVEHVITMNTHKCQ